MKKLLLLILAPSVLWAGQFTVNLPSKPSARTGAVEIDSLRTLHSKVYKLSAVDTTSRRIAVIGVEPLHYVDDAGKLKDFNFDLLTRFDVYALNLNEARGIDLRLSGNSITIEPDTLFKNWSRSIGGGNLSMAAASNFITRSGWTRIASGTATSLPSVSMLQVNEQNTQDSIAVSNYDKSVRVGRFVVDYSTSKPGKMRYTRKDAYIEFDPEFSSSEVGIELNINPNGVKSNYILSKGLDSLSWKYSASHSFEAQIGSKGKGKLKDRTGVSRGELSDFTAKDSTGKSLDLTTVYKDGRLVVRVNLAGTVGKITIDPSIRDTVEYGTLYKAYESNNASYNIARNTSTASAITGSFPAGNIFASPNHNVERTFMGWDLTGQPTATGVDSVRMWVRLDPLDVGTQIDSVVFAEATFHGAPSVTWFPLFTGHDSSTNAYSVHEYGKAWVRGNIGVGKDTTFSFLFSTTGKADVLAALGHDTLSVVALSQWDVNYVDPSTNAQYVDLNYAAAPWPYLVIYYSAEEVVGWSKKVIGIVPSKVNGIAPSKVLGIQ